MVLPEIFKSHHYVKNVKDNRYYKGYQKNILYVCPAADMI